MSEPFDPAAPLILVQARLWGPGREAGVQLALDTGAVRSVISVEVATVLGFEPAAAAARTRILTASGEVLVPVLVMDRLEAIRQARCAFPVLCHSLPPATRLDGLPGLDFVRGHRLVADFRAGLLSLE